MLSMMSLTVLLIVFIAIGLPALLIFLLALARILTGRRRGEANADETRLIQEIHHGMTKLEKRIEALETILIESERKNHE